MTRRGKRGKRRQGEARHCSELVEKLDRFEIKEVEMSKSENRENLNVNREEEPSRTEFAAAGKPNESSKTSKKKKKSMAAQEKKSAAAAKEKKNAKKKHPADKVSIVSATSTKFWADCSYSSSESDDKDEYGFRRRDWRESPKELAEVNREVESPQTELAAAAAAGKLNDSSSSWKKKKKKKAKQKHHPADLVLGVPRTIPKYSSSDPNDKDEYGFSRRDWRELFSLPLAGGSPSEYREWMRRANLALPHYILKWGEEGEKVEDYEMLEVDHDDGSLVPSCVVYRLFFKARNLKSDAVETFQAGYCNEFDDQPEEEEVNYCTKKSFSSWFRVPIYRRNASYMC